MSYDFSFSYIWGAGPDLMSGLWMTIRISLLSIVFSVVIGTVGAALRVFHVPGLSHLVAGYVNFIRSTPLLVQLFFVFYGLASIGIPISDFWSGVLALSLWGGAYNTENIRGGFLAIPKGLGEAAGALALRSSHYLLLIALPVGLRVSIPAMLNTSVSVLKNSAYLQAIGLAELTFVAMDRVAMDFRTLEMFAAIGAIYLALVLALSFSVRGIEHVLQKPFRAS
ncbi:amino acid ABC transporter permease [Kaustia mangrovi]|uniref:Amino acid ABC transporter permease n=1 Tax=Kaustia mangrovi TaxID=2593653 RepID=A0A7S8HD84_9HYPH|nr:amino acid ABC transporter permease [Kaustia mangrovi]QPC44053.1 amino acid ABC transporter permease [Kaustia mangrovi]